MSIFKKIFFLQFLFILILFNKSFAVIKINIESTVKKPYVITAISLDNVKNIKNKVIQDLKNSGRFTFKKPYEDNLTNNKDISFIKNSSLQIEYIIYLKYSNGNLDFYLYNTRLKTKVISKRFLNIDKNNISALSHNIADIIYKKITGLKGYFSTKISFVEKDKKENIFKLIIADYDGKNMQVLLTSKYPISSPNFSKNGKKLTYVSYKNGKMGIFVVDLKTFKNNLIINSGGINSAPSFSSDGEYLIFARSRINSPYTDIALINLKTRKWNYIISGGINTSPQFIDNDEKIIFVSNRYGNPQIFQVDKKGNNLERITYNGFQNFSPKISPNNLEMVYMQQTNRSGNYNIFLYNMDDKITTKLTSGVVDKSPSFSPNGEMILYISIDENARSELKMVSKSGDVNITLKAMDKNKLISSPVWSPWFK